MMNLIPFEGGNAQLPAYLSDAQALADINKDIVRTAQFPTMSIKGKVFTLNRDGKRKILTKPDEPDEVAQSIGVVVLRSNMGGKTWYGKGYVEGDTSPPDCFSHDGVAPSPHAKDPQAKKCQLCPRHQWKKMTGEDGSVREGRECSDVARLAIAAPDDLEAAMLLRVPPGSRKNLRDAVKVINERKIPYNAVVMKVSFDPEQASPTLRFKPIGLLSDADYAKVKEMYDGELVRAIVGLDDQMEAAPEPEPAVTTDELDAAIAARDVSNKAKEAAAQTPAPTAAPAARKKAAAPAVPKVTTDELDDVLPAAKAEIPAPSPAPVAAAPVAPAADSAAGSLLSDLDALLGSTDD